MKILANKDIRNLFLAVSVIWAASLLLAQGFLWLRYQRLSLCLLFIFLLAAAAIWVVCCSYFKKQNKIMEQAVSQINVYLDGDSNARIECDSEGELYRLFHSVNSLAAVLNAHADNELREKEFLKNTISDISHQLKTPLAALNIYNGLLHEEDIEASSVKEFADLSEQELDRMETLVQSLLKITRLDAGSVTLEKGAENVADMLRDVELHFAYRAKQEHKELVLSGPEEVLLFCDRDWLTEAIDNIVKNALDHTESGDAVHITWKALPNAVQIAVKDNGCGIHPDLQDTVYDRILHTERMDPLPHGLGLGLSLCRCFAARQGGNLLLQSEVGKGTTVTVSLPAERCGVHRVQDVPFHYAGGFQPVMMELSDALPYEGYKEKYLD